MNSRFKNCLRLSAFHSFFCFFFWFSEYFDFESSRFKNYVNYAVFSSLLPLSIIRLYLQKEWFCKIKTKFLIFHTYLLWVYTKVNWWKILYIWKLKWKIVRSMWLIDRSWASKRMRKSRVLGNAKDKETCSERQRIWQQLKWTNNSKPKKYWLKWTNNCKHKK